MTTFQSASSRRLELPPSGGRESTFKITSRNSDYFEMTFDIEVSSLDHIETIINSLRTKKVVQHVARTKY